MKQRLVYIDVLRGICIFVVVYTHLVGFCTSDMPTTGVHRFLTLLFLQMFFFISGFVGYKDTAKWTSAYIKAFLVKKVNTLLIPSVCAMSLNQFVCKGSLAGMWDTISGGAKGGYWFTIALFVMELVYCAIMVGIWHLKTRNVGNLVLATVMVAAYILNKTSLSHGWVADLLCLGGVLYYMPLFLLGVLCRREQERFHRLIANRWIQLLLLGVLVVGFTIRVVPLIVLSITICLVAYYVVKGFCEQPGEGPGTVVGALCKKAEAMLSVIGQYTLQIYFLHFMLLFRLPDSVLTYLQQSHVQTCYGHTFSSVAELVIIGCCSLLICFLSICLSLIIRQLPFAHRLLFGK